jgi:hypothetical protein
MKSALFAVALALAACQPPTPPPGGEECDRAYEHLRFIRCEPVRPISGTWVDVCRNARRNGLMSLKCVRDALDVDAAQRCGVSCN